MNNYFEYLEFDKPLNGYKAVCSWIENRYLFNISDKLYDKLLLLKQNYEDCKNDIEKFKWLSNVYYVMGLSIKGEIRKWSNGRLFKLKDNTLYFKLYTL